MLNENKDKTEEQVEAIKEVGEDKIPPVNSDIYYINIVGQIEGHSILGPNDKATKYEHILPILENIEESSKIKGFVVLLNTLGGDVEAGLAISEMISGMTKPSVSLVLGGGHSIGVCLASSADYSFIAPTATMTIHPIRMNGLVIGVSQTYDYFKKMQERIIRFVCNHSHIDRDKLYELMLTTNELANDVGQILIGQEAVDYGIIDSVGSISDAIRELRSRI